MNDHLTNRDVYRELLGVTRNVTRSLDEYLRALWLLGRAERARDVLPVDLVVGALRALRALPFLRLTKRGGAPVSGYPMG